MVHPFLGWQRRGEKCWIGNSKSLELKYQLVVVILSSSKPSLVSQNGQPSEWVPRFGFLINCNESKSNDQVHRHMHTTRCPVTHSSKTFTQRLQGHFISEEPFKKCSCFLFHGEREVVVQTTCISKYNRFLKYSLFSIRKISFYEWSHLEEYLIHHYPILFLCWCQEVYDLGFQTDAQSDFSGRMNSISLHNTLKGVLHLRDLRGRTDV